MNDADLDDGGVRERLTAAASRVAVDVDAGWSRLIAELEREDGELEPIPPPPVLPGGGGAVRPARRASSVPRFVMVAAAVAALLLGGRPVLRVTVHTVGFLRDIVIPAASAPPTTTTPPPPPTSVPTPAPTTTTTAPPAASTTTTSTTAPPAVAPAPPAGTDLAHAEVSADDEYHGTVRRVHDQINAAIGYGNLRFDRLAGSDQRVEGLLGLRPQYDARLRDIIGHLQEAQRNSNREAASRAHAIIEDVERQLATEAQG